MISLATKLRQCEGLVDTRDFNDFENKFIKDNCRRLDETKSTTWMSEKQVDTLERIWEKHFV